MKPLLPLLILTAFMMPLSVCAEDVEARTIEKIGSYDSRSVAIAFMGSEVYKKTRGKLLTTKMAEHKKAKEEGDKQKIKELEAWGKAQQQLLHKQGFGTEAVTDILAHISDQLPGIKKKAKVDLLISKWDTKALASHEGVPTVDITLRLIEAFKPTEKQKKSALEIQEKEPVPSAKLKNHAKSPKGK